MRDPRRSGDLAILICIAAATVLVHMLTGHQYGFHRDELATLEDARHLAWGFVAYPPVTPFFGRLSLALFGTSLAGFRFFAAVAQAVVLVVIGLVTRELGGRRGAQLVAVAAGVMCFPLPVTQPVVNMPGKADSIARCTRTARSTDRRCS